MLVLTRYLLLEKKKNFYDDVFPSSTKKFIPQFRNECSIQDVANLYLQK